MAYLAGYWKLGSSDLQALSASLRYFSLGEIVLTDQEGNAQNSITPYEMAFDVGYSRKLSDKFSMGVVFRYIYSDLGFHYDESSVSDASGASAFAADISGYYTTYPIIIFLENLMVLERKSTQLRWRINRRANYEMLEQKPEAAH